MLMLHLFRYSEGLTRSAARWKQTVNLDKFLVFLWVGEVMAGGGDVAAADALVDCSRIVIV